MATRFVRVDLSETARDYRPIAVEPGVAMLDRSGANDRIVFRWLGGMAAEPVWEEDAVGFYVRDDKGGRLEDAICLPASAQDLQGSLRDDLAKLRQRLDQSRGETPTERTLRKILVRTFEELVDNPARTDLDSYFFRYRDVLGNWRLIWCWGYERLDHEPAPSVVCTDPDCNLLFVRRPGKSPRCPSCAGTLQTRPKRKTNWKKAALALLLLLLLLGGIGWLLWRPALVVTPAQFAGPVGTRIDCHVTATGLFSKKDVTHEAVGIAVDPRVARFDPADASIRLMAAGTTNIELRCHGRTAVVNVTAAPLGRADELVSLELAPSRPIALPLGQMMRLQALAMYGDGHRAQIPSERLKWFSQEKSVPGLELYHDDEIVGAVGATKAGAGPLNVYATYQGQESNRVTFTSVDADPNVKLAIDVDRTLRIAGEGGRVVLTATSSSGDVELIPALASFTSSKETVLKFAGKPGKFAAVTPGKSMVAGSHIAAKEPANLEFQVCDPARARVRFDPLRLTVVVNQKAALTLVLEAELDEGGKTQVQRAELLGPNVSYYIAQPDSVRYNPPILTGLAAAAPFRVSGSIPVLPAANADVEVVDAAAKVLRVVPSAPSPLAAGQQAALTVEQQAGDSGTWQEVRPDAVAWNVPANVIWTPPTNNLRPTVALPPDLAGEAKLDASLGGVSASVAFARKGAAPDPAEARLVLDRETRGKYLPVGQSQRYSVLVEKNGQSEPAADVHWPGNFENEYVKWEAPVLTAKQEGYTQFLRAEVGGRNVLWHTTTYRPGEFAPVIVDGQNPDWVKIFSQQGPQQVQQVRFPVGATFSDFKVEVHYPDGYTRFVTKKAVLRTPEPPADALLTADHGKFLGLRPGSTNVTAEFQGLASQFPLKVDVSADVDIDKIAVEPGNVPLRPGETYGLTAIGYKDGKSVGDITGLGNLAWKSSNPEVARLSGASVIASGLGQSQVTVERKGLTSQPATVTVKMIAEDLRVEPKTIEMFLGESQQLGDSIRVMRGDLDVSQQATAVPESPGVVRFDPATRTLTAIGTGAVPLGIAMGDKLARVLVVVRPHGVEPGSKLVVEPGSLILAPGQADRLSVFVEMPSGEKVSANAVYKVTDPAVAGVDEAIGRVRALQPGRTEIKVFVLGLEPATVPVEVTSEAIAELIADPAVLEMAAGDHAHLRVFGRAPTSGLKEMFPQSDLKVAPRKTDTVDVVGGEDVQAKAIGEDTIDVAWRDKLKIAVPVKVAANAITNLQIDPNPATINTGQALTYQVSAMRGGNRVILTPEEGLRLNVTDPAVAGVAAGTTVVSSSPGSTKLVADFGGQKAEAVLNVTPGVASVLPAGNGLDVISNGVVYDGRGGRVVIGDGAAIGDVKPVGKVAALVFEPPFYRAGVQAMPQTAKLLRQYANGGFDDVSNDPNVKVSNPNSMVAKIEKVDGGWKVSPVAPGLTKITATLGDETAGMAIEINGDAASGGTIAGQLVVNPTTLSLWSGETQVIGNAVIDPGGGQAPVPVEVTVKAPDGQGIVSVDGNKVTGRSVGDVPVTVSTAGGQLATVNVHVSAADSLSINPPEISLQAGQSTAPAVMAKSADGTEVAVPAAIESLDKNVLDADPAQGGQFVARSQGQTQLHAVYRGQEVFAKVSVSGRRFQSVKAAHNRIDKEHFDMTIEVLAAGGEGELEYRVYAEGDASAKENWVPNQPEGDTRKVTLRSDPLSYNQGDEYHLIIEARDKNTKRVEKYPLTLIRSVTVEQQKDSPQPNEPK